MQVDPGFTTARLDWSGQGPGFLLRWKTIGLDDRIGICGAVYYPSNSTRKQSERMLRRSYIEYNNKKIMRDLSFFFVVASRKQLESATANCAATAVRAPEKWTVDLYWDSERARF